MKKHLTVENAFYAMAATYLSALVVLGVIAIHSTYQPPFCYDVSYVGPLGAGPSERSATVCFEDEQACDKESLEMSDHREWLVSQCGHRARRSR